MKNPNRSGERHVGYSGTPLLQKLGIKGGHRVALLEAPEKLPPNLARPPRAVSVQRKLGGPAFDVIVLFVDRRSILSQRFNAAARSMKPSGGLWIAWPKKASGVVTDVTEDLVRSVALAGGLVDNKVCAIDEVWSGLRCVYRLKDRPKTVTIRRVEKRDLPSVARLAGQLVRMHHDVDPRRFMLVDNVEEGYAWWLGREMTRKKAVVLVASRGTDIVGYAYGTLEDRDWNMLLDKHGAVHDVLVASNSRGKGVGQKLVDAMVGELKNLGAPRIVLSTMIGNEQAQRLFKRCGFRPTMLEMTLG
jgi:ribosomal protein S18 acetylase RimI-like enzyme